MQQKELTQRANTVIHAEYFVHSSEDFSVTRLNFVLGLFVISMGSLIPFVSGFAGTAGPSLEWSVAEKMEGIFRVRMRVVTPQSVKQSVDYELGYVQHLIGRSGLCYRGKPKEVIEQIIQGGLDVTSDESCESTRIVGSRIVIGECSLEGGPSSYTVSIAPCEQ